MFDTIELIYCITSLSVYNKTVTSRLGKRIIVFSDQCSFSLCWEFSMNPQLHSTFCSLVAINSSRTLFLVLFCNHGEDNKLVIKTNVGSTVGYYNNLEVAYNFISLKFYKSQKALILQGGCISVSNSKQVGSSMGLLKKVWLVLIFYSLTVSSNILNGVQLKMAAYDVRLIEKLKKKRF